MAQVIKLEVDGLQSSPTLNLIFREQSRVGFPRFYPVNMDAVKICAAMDRDFLYQDKLDCLKNISCIRVELV